MKNKKIEEFVDRLSDESELLTDVDNLTQEEREIAAMWNELGELEEESNPNAETVLEFKDRLTAYRIGWDAAQEDIAPKKDRKTRKVTPIWQFTKYMMVASAAAAFALGGFWSFLQFERNQNLQLELQSARDMLALSMLQQPSAPKRLEGLAAAAKISHPSESLRAGLVKTFDRDSNINVRLAAVAALGTLPRDEALTILLERMENESSPLVQLEVLRMVLELVGEEGEAEMLKRLESLSLKPRVRTYLEGNNPST